MRFFLAALCLALAACASTSEKYVRVRFVPAMSDEATAACRSVLGRKGGCAVQEKNGDWTIYGPPPRNVEDFARLAIIGHEFYCHAWLHQGHTNVDPSNDCVGPQQDSALARSASNQAR